MKTQNLHLFDKMSYRWNFQSLGGVVRVKISTGDDIVHLPELDKKLWTVMSCPVDGLHFDRRTLEYLDSDNNGKINIDEVVEASQWLGKVLKDPDLLLDGSSSLPLSNIDTSTDTGAALHETAVNLLQCLGITDAKIDVKDTSDFKTVFSNADFNGDGIITAVSCSDPLDRKAFDACVGTVGHVADMGGCDGIDAGLVEEFYTALNDCVEWSGIPDSDKSILPYGDKTSDALAAIEAVSEKINDYFMRCKLIAFDESAQGAVCASVESITSAANAGTLDKHTSELMAAPLAKPHKEAVLPYSGINPAWQDAFDKARSEVFDKEYPSAQEITKEQWEAVVAKFVAYKSWLAAKKGSKVESLGLEAIKEIIGENRKEALLELIAQDKSKAEYFQSLIDLDKLVHYNQHFCSFLRNFVTLTDFYSLEKDVWATFEEGKLYIDQRCCDLCLRVSDMGTHADMSALSGMYLLYCECTRKDCAPFNIVAVLTNGDIRNLRVGVNAIFYDREGNDWNAVVTKIVDNPISISQAFWAPYRKFAKFVGDKVKKSASEKNDKSLDNINIVKTTPEAGAPDGTATPKPQFDIAKFAGIFAAIGMAVGYIGAFMTELITGLTAAPVWKTLAVIAGIMLIISAPSCFLAGIKLHRRNLGPVLNANGWAINTDVMVNIVFGTTLTSVARYPKITLDDPFAAKKTPWWKKVLVVLGVLLVIAAIMYFSGCFDSLLNCGVHE